MLKYILKRLAALVLTLLIIISVSFIIIHLMPVQISPDGSLPPEVEMVMREKYGLDQPVLKQYFKYMKNFLRMDFGFSLNTYPGWYVMDLLATKLPTTIFVNAFSLFITIPFGMLFGILAALNKDTWIDRLISFVVMMFVSIPSFIFASMMQYLFAFKLGWFPLIFSSEPGLTLAKLHSIVLPVLALSFSGIASITRLLRAELSETLNSEFMLMATAKGLTRTQAVLRHAIRNSFVPMSSMIIGMFLSVLGGSMVIERIFSIPGIGGLSISSINTGDHYLTMANIFYYTVISLVSVLLVDLSYGIIDPRIRMGGGKRNV